MGELTQLRATCLTWCRARSQEAPEALAPIREVLPHLHLETPGSRFLEQMGDSVAMSWGRQVVVD
ncbi:MAG: hypothetical protein ACLQUY_22590 [Ktedonobacterales bacterium]